MNYHNPRIPEGINVARESVPAEFLRLLAGLLLVVVVAALVLHLAGGWLARQIPFALEDIGQIWSGDGEGGTQVDVAAISWREKRLLVGEAKWTETNVDQAVVRKLLEKTIPMVRALLPEKGAGWQVLPFLFARRGFAKEAFKLCLDAGVQMAAVSPIEDRLEVLRP